MTHLSRDDADRIHRDNGRVRLSMKLVTWHSHVGNISLLRDTDTVAGSIVFSPDNV